MLTNRVFLGILLILFVTCFSNANISQLVYTLTKELIEKREYKKVIKSYNLYQHSHILMPAMRKFAQTDGFSETLTKFIVASLVKDHAAKGSLYEIETALKIAKDSEYRIPTEVEKIVSFNQAVESSDGICREFDIITSKRYIECKTVNWRHAKNCRTQFLEQQKIVQEINKDNKEPKSFIVQSKYPISPKWRIWFSKQKITGFCDSDNRDDGIDNGELV